MKRYICLIPCLLFLAMSHLLAQNTYGYFVYDGNNVSSDCCYSKSDIKNESRLFMRWVGYYNDKSDKILTCLIEDQSWF